MPLDEQDFQRRSWHEHLRWLKDEWKDEFPPEIIHSNAPDNKYKVRKSWFAGLMWDFELMINQHQITDPDVLRQVREFIGYLQSEFVSKALTTREDIEWGNRIIDLVLHTSSPTQQGARPE